MSDSRIQMENQLIETAKTFAADYTIGFARLNTRGDADAYSAGSGSLVTVGSISGILTAGHVLDNLPDRGEVGIVRFPPDNRIQRLTIDMNVTDKIVISAGTFGPRGPDLGDSSGYGRRMWTGTAA